jgi:hypothetical protein
VAEDGRVPVALPALGGAESRRIQLRERSAEPIGIGDRRRRSGSRVILSGGYDGTHRGREERR